MRREKHLIVGFSGTAGEMTRPQRAALTAFFINRVVEKDSIVFHGGCVGVDQYVHSLCLKHGVLVEVFPSVKHDHWFVPAGSYSWGRVHEAMLPLERNHVIAEVPARLVAVPETETMVLRSGTWATVRYALKANRPVILILPNGSIRMENEDARGVLTH
jgi:predicted Rossmann fold nucleotide-binding protein DprA/Smf involved in DNA uptake